MIALCGLLMFERNYSVVVVSYFTFLFEVAQWLYKLFRDMEIKKSRQSTRLWLSFAQQWASCNAASSCSGRMDGTLVLWKWLRECFLHLSILGMLKRYFVWYLMVLECLDQWGPYEDHHRYNFELLKGQLVSFCMLHRFKQKIGRESNLFACIYLKTKARSAKFHSFPACKTSL